MPLYVLMFFFVCFEIFLDICHSVHADVVSSSSWDIQAEGEWGREWEFLLIPNVSLFFFNTSLIPMMVCMC